MQSSEWILPMCLIWGEYLKTVSTYHMITDQNTDLNIEGEKEKIKSR
jgi:hypothetical protein